MLKLAGEFIEGQLADHMAELDPHLVETLPVLLKGGNLLHIPTNAGWTEGLVGSGSTSLELTRLQLATGATASSVARLYANFFGFYSGSWHNRINWDKKLYFVFNYTRVSSDSEVIGRLQVKETNAEGELAAKGLGIRVDNLALKGESYGTELGVVDLLTIVSSKLYQITIIHYPGSKIEWYVNGVLKGTQSTANKIPNGESSANIQIVSSIKNGVTGGVNAYSFIFHPKIWQEA